MLVGGMGETSAVQRHRRSRCTRWRGAMRRTDARPVAGWSRVAGWLRAADAPAWAATETIGADGMTQSLSQTLGQYMRLEQKLTPQLIQSLNILQLNAMALENHVAEELERNVALEVAEATAPDSNGEPPASAQDAPPNAEQDRFERLDRMTREYGNEAFSSTVYEAKRRAGVGERDAKMDAMANVASRPQSLAEHLMTQWTVLDLDDDVRRAGEAIIYSLEDDGYLKVRLDEVAAKVKPPVGLDVVQRALARVQRLDPVGVAARDYQECLLLQLEAMPGDNRIEKELVRNHLHDLARNRFPRIAKATGYSLGEVTEAVKAMQHVLCLHPGYQVIDRDVPRITPDAIIEYADGDGGLEVRLTRATDPHLRISKSALDMLADKESSKQVRDFIRGHVESAHALIDAIRFRRERLLAVAARIAEHQREFFEVGPEGLRVLRMSDMARELECDPSTISRTVSGKYVQTPRGIFPLRYFFTGGTETSEGKSTSWDSVKASVQTIIEQEDKKSPLNDDQIAAKLAETGIDISRRTIAKYRQQLDIPPARQRREF